MYEKKNILLHSAYRHHGQQLKDTVVFLIKQKAQLILLCKTSYCLCSYMTVYSTFHRHQALLGCANHQTPWAAVAQGWSQCLVIGRLLVPFPWSAYWSVLGQDIEPQTAPDVCVATMHCSHHHQCMNNCKLLWTKASAKYPKCKWSKGNYNHDLLVENHSYRGIYSVGSQALIIMLTAWSCICIPKSSGSWWKGR